MKQFQIVQQIVDQSSGTIIANFGLPILIQPGSQITLDKFQATIENNLTNISLTDQIVAVSTDGITYNNANIPAKVYSNATELIQTFNNYINDTFNAVNPDNANEGLKFSTQVSSTGVEFLFQTVFPAIVIPTPTRCSLNGDIWTFTGGILQDWEGTSIAGVLNGGGFSLKSQMRPDIIGGQYSIQFGLKGTIAGNQNAGIKIIQAESASPSSFGVVSLFSSVTNQSIIVPSIIFTNHVGDQFFVYFFQQSGYYACQITRIDFLGNEFISFTYTGQALGVWSSLDSISPYFSGTSASSTPYTPVNDNPGFGNFIQTSQGGSGGNLRTMLLNFESAQELRLGFGIPTDLVILSPTNSDSGTYTSSAPLDFSNVRSALTVSIEVMELPLESYIVGNSPYQVKNPTQGRRQQGSRNNVIGYFTPEIKDKSTNIYRHQATQYQWLDIINKQPMEFTSLNFRVFITETGEPIQATNLSFNILVKEK